MARRRRFSGRRSVGKHSFARTKVATCDALPSCITESSDAQSSVAVNLLSGFMSVNVAFWWGCCGRILCTESA